MTNHTNRFFSHPDTLVTDLQDELVLVHGASGKAYQFNGSARCLYLLLPATRTELIQGLCAKFSVDAALAASDTDEVIGQMQAAGLILADEHGDK